MRDLFSEKCNIITTLKKILRRKKEASFFYRRGDSISRGESYRITSQYRRGQFSYRQEEKDTAAEKKTRGEKNKSSLLKGEIKNSPRLSQEREKEKTTPSFE